MDLILKTKSQSFCDSLKSDKDWASEQNLMISSFKSFELQHHSDTGIENQRMNLNNDNQKLHAAVHAGSFVCWHPACIAALSFWLSPFLMCEWCSTSECVMWWCHNHHDCVIRWSHPVFINHRVFLWCKIVPIRSHLTIITGSKLVSRHLLTA